MLAKYTDWPRPKQILLVTYNRLQHLGDTLDYGVVGIKRDGASSATKARVVRENDWVLIRASSLAKVAVTRPLRVTGRPIVQDANRGPRSPYPDLLFEEEKESSRLIYQLRIPVTMEGGPRTKPNCVNWDSLSELSIIGRTGKAISEPQQWGRKFTANVIEHPREVRLLLELIVNCTAQEPESAPAEDA